MAILVNVIHLKFLSVKYTQRSVWCMAWTGDIKTNYSFDRRPFISGSTLTLLNVRNEQRKMWRFYSDLRWQESQDSRMFSVFWKWWGISKIRELKEYTWIQTKDVYIDMSTSILNCNRLKIKIKYPQLWLNIQIRYKYININSI